MSKIVTLVVGFTLVASACATEAVESSVSMATPNTTLVEQDTPLSGTTTTLDTPPSIPAAENHFAATDEEQPSDPPTWPRPAVLGGGEVVSCSADGVWPEGAEAPSILVSWTGEAWEFAGPEVRATGMAQVAFDYHTGSPSGVFVGVVGLVDGMNWDDFLVEADEHSLGRYHARGFGASPWWDRPDWVVFLGSLEHGCLDRIGAVHRVVWNWHLPPAHYVVFGHSSPAAGKGSVVTADLIAEFDVKTIRQTPEMTDAATNCAHLTASALSIDGRPLTVYSQQPDGDPLCGSGMDEWIGKIQLVECQDQECAEFTERTLVEVERLWAGPYGLEIISDGRMVTAWYVASSGHPVSEIARIVAVCGSDSCELTEVKKLAPWDLKY